jgi:hypothetical protein
MTDLELLQALFDFLTSHNYIFGEEAVIRDMVLRYKQPPLTLYNRVCLQMTQKDYDRLSDLLKLVLERFDPNVITLEEAPHEPT